MIGSDVRTADCIGFTNVTKQISAGGAPSCDRDLKCAYKPQNLLESAAAVVGAGSSGLCGGKTAGGVNVLHLQTLDRLPSMRKRRGKGRKKGKSRGRAGRRPTGLQSGENMSDYPQFTMRLPPGTVATLRQLPERQTRPMRRVVVDPIDMYPKAVEPPPEP